MALDAGTALGPYEIVGLIGAGGMGEVYRARDPRLQRTVAIKVLPPSFTTDPDRLRRFEHEARAAGSLNHPNIVAVYDLGSHDGAPYIVTELLEGQTLRDKLVTQLPVERAIDYATQMAKGLAAAHAKGILHRDLKPENVFITRDGRAKILDFGLAKSTAPATGDGVTITSLPDELSTPGTVLGTAGYMSPEQVLGKSVDARSDIFSFGSVLYEMLAGRRAFQHGSALETMHAIVHLELPDTADLTPRVPVPLLSILRRCLAKDVDERFQSASDLAFALSALSQSQVGTGAASAPVSPRTSRRWLAATVAGVLIAAVAAAATYTAVRSRPASGPPSFRQLTFGRGIVGEARFAPDGQTVIYDAIWDGKPGHLFSIRVDTAESTALPLPKARIASVSKSGELAILRAEDTLALVPLGGSGVRDIAEHVDGADWAPDGVTLAAIRHDLSGRQWLEYPLEQIIFRGAEGYARMDNPRVSPNGELVALIENSVSGKARIALVDKSGAVRQRSANGNIGAGLAWTPDGREVWFNASDTGLNFAVHALARDGRERVVHRSMGSVRIADVARDGRALMVQERIRAGMTVVGLDGTGEQDLSWLDFSRPWDLSNDGKVVLFREGGVAAGATTAVFVRPTDGSPAVRLGDGTAWALSPDGKWALVTKGEVEGLALLSTGAGQARVLPTGNLTAFRDGRWLPDGTAVVFNAREPGRPPRVYVQSVTSGLPQPITPEGVTVRREGVRPDSSQVLASGNGRPFWLYPLDGGAPFPAKGFTAGDTAIRWSGDGKFVWTLDQTSGVPRIMRVDVATGRRDVWREIKYSDPVGLIPGWLHVVMSADGRIYVHGYNRTLDDVYVAEGLR